MAYNPNKGSPITTCPASSSSLTLLPTVFLLLLNSFLFSFYNFLLNRPVSSDVPIFQGSPLCLFLQPVLIISFSLFQEARLCHRSPLQTCSLIGRWMGPSWWEDEIYRRKRCFAPACVEEARGRETQRKHKRWRGRNEWKGAVQRHQWASDGIPKTLPEWLLIKPISALHI